MQKNSKYVTEELYDLVRDGPFDFSWGGGANPKKNIEHVSNGRKKNRTSLTPAKKNIEHKKFLN
jgi:hypothetical protein